MCVCLCIRPYTVLASFSEKSNIQFILLDNLYLISTMKIYDVFNEKKLNGRSCSLAHMKYLLIHYDVTGTMLVLEDTKIIEIPFLSCYKYTCVFIIWYNNMCYIIFFPKQSIDYLHNYMWSLQGWLYHYKIAYIFQVHSIFHHIWEIVNFNWIGRNQCFTVFHKWTYKQICKLT